MKPPHEIGYYRILSFIEYIVPQIIRQINIRFDKTAAINSSHSTVARCMPKISND
jgi:phosphoribulokinase